ncbi:GGDEF domain-containing response regulator [Catenovulum sediminis]|uniref:diguanylate cyclase n=1 Tax=Catenovulum sediminis TaxID=1740262 RepID=A0ABV1RHT0_9ALTE
MSSVNKLKVLIADDDLITRMLLQRNLTAWGYQVHVASDGEQAWDIVNAEDNLRLFIVDWGMPKLDGLEFCRTLKSECDYFLYIIMLTGRSGTDNIVEAMSGGADDFVTKPFVAEELRVRLQVGERILEQEKKLEFYANRDYLTGAWNRRVILNHLREEWERSVRERTKLSVVIFDLDMFKQINDRYGHQAGDQAISVFCSIVMGNIRPYDKLGRYGGEEFLLVLPNTHEQEAVLVAERCCTQVADVNIPLPGQDTLTVTVSAGVAISDAGNPPMNDLFKNCDKALYQAKNNGRNQVVLYRQS